MSSATVRAAFRCRSIRTSARKRTATRQMSLPSVTSYAEDMHRWTVCRISSSCGRRWSQGRLSDTRMRRGVGGRTTAISCIGSRMSYPMWRILRNPSTLTSRRRSRRTWTPSSRLPPPCVGMHRMSEEMIQLRRLFSTLTARADYAMRR